MCSRATYFDSPLDEHHSFYDTCRITDGHAFSGNARKLSFFFSYLLSLFAVAHTGIEHWHPASYRHTSALSSSIYRLDFTSSTLARYRHTYIHHTAPEAILPPTPCNIFVSPLAHVSFLFPLSGSRGILAHLENTATRTFTPIVILFIHSYTHFCPGCSLLLLLLLLSAASCISIHLAHDAYCPVFYSLHIAHLAHYVYDQVSGYSDEATYLRATAVIVLAVMKVNCTRKTASPSERL